MSKSGRQQMAYEHYVRKHALQRQHQTARAHTKVSREMKAKMKALPVDKPRVTATAEPVSGPTAISTSEGSAGNETQQP